MSFVHGVDFEIKHGGKREYTEAQYITMATANLNSFVNFFCEIARESELAHALNVFGNALTSSEQESLQTLISELEFISNYAEDHAIMLPGRIPGYKQTDIQLLPSNTTKMIVWCAYVEAAGDLPVRVAGINLFHS